MRRTGLLIVVLWAWILYSPILAQCPPATPDRQITGTGEVDEPFGPSTPIPGTGTPRPTPDLGQQIHDTGALGAATYRGVSQEGIDGLIEAAEAVRLRWHVERALRHVWAAGEALRAGDIPRARNENQQAANILGLVEDALPHEGATP